MVLRDLLAWRDSRVHKSAISTHNIVLPLLLELEGQSLFKLKLLSNSLQRLHADVLCGSVTAAVSNKNSLLSQCVTD